MLVKKLADICHDLLLKSCNLDYFYKRWTDYGPSMYCQIDEFLTGTCQMIFYFCKCPKWGYKSEVIKFCDWCLFCKDEVTFSTAFNEIFSHTKNFKLVNTFNLFINIIYYWCSVNKHVVDTFFSLLPTFYHVCL